MLNIHVFSSVKKKVTISSSAFEACRKVDAVVIVTEWKEFRDIDWEAVYVEMKKPAFLFDGRLLLDAEKLKKIGFNVRFHHTRTYPPVPHVMPC